MKFKSNVKNVMVAIGSEVIQFENGIYETEDKNIIKALAETKGISLLEEKKKSNKKNK